MESVRLAEEGLDKALLYLQRNQADLFGNDVACVRHRVESLLKSNSGRDMINTARTGIAQCLAYWEQTPKKHHDLQEILQEISDQLNRILAEPGAQKSKLDQAQQRVARRIHAFLETFIQREDVALSGNGGRIYSAPTYRSPRTRNNRSRKRGR